MPQKMIALSARAYLRATVFSVSASMPQSSAIASGVRSLTAFAQRLEILGMRLDVLLVVKILIDDRVQQRRQHRHVAARLELQHMRRMPLQGLAARVHDDQRRAALRRLLEEGRGDRMILGRVGADDDDDVGILRGHERRRHRAPSRCLPSAPPPTRRGRAACSDRHCWCRSRRAPASGRDRPPRSSPWPSRSRRARRRRACRGSSSSPRRRDRAPRPRSLRGNASRDWRDRSRRRRVSARRPCGSSARSDDRRCVM